MVRLLESYGNLVTPSRELFLRGLKGGETTPGTKGMKKRSNYFFRKASRSLLSVEVEVQKEALSLQRTKKKRE